MDGFCQLHVVLAGVIRRVLCRLSVVSIGLGGFRGLGDGAGQQAGLERFAVV